LKHKFMAAALALGIFVWFNPLPRASAQDPPAQSKSATRPTADNAKNNPTDRDLMQQIRKGIVDDKSLSTSAHNVKVIAQHGKVTLRGPVQSEEEKQAIEKIATEVAGAGNVTNQITIKAARAKKTQ
jgi:hyperosmotically inducible protein